MRSTAADLPRGRRRLPLGQARPRLRPPGRRPRRRPPRLRRRLKAAVALSAATRPARGPILQFVNLVEGGERAVDVQARRRLGHARGADRRDRRRRGALVLLSRSARLDGRPRLRRWRARSQRRTPSTTCSTRTPGSPGPGQGGDERVAPRWPRSRAGMALEPAERELVKKLLAFPPRWPRRPSAARRTGSPPTRWTRAAFTAFYASAGRRRRPELASGSRSASRRSG